MRCGCRCTSATRSLAQDVFDPDYNWLKAFADRARLERDRATRFLYTGIALVIQLVLGLLIALLLDTDRKGYGVLRALMTLPLVVPPAVTGMMFLLMLDGSFGVLEPLALRARPAVAAISDPRHQLDGAGRRAARRHLAMDALHGADHAGGPALAAEGAFRGGRHRRRHARPRPSSG